jgi:hypothetical protein
MLFCDEIASGRDFLSNQENSSLRLHGVRNNPRTVLFPPRLRLRAKTHRNVAQHSRHRHGYFIPV